MRTLDVIGAGELFVNMIMSGFDAWPQPGREAVAREYHREIGGGAAITACGLAKLGLRTSVMGIVGSDQGAWIVDELRRSLVDTSAIRFDTAEPTGFTVVATMPEDRAFFTYPGANRGFAELLTETTSAGGLSHARHVHLASAPALDNAAALLACIHENGCTVSFDGGWHEDWLSDPRSVALLPLIDVYLPNESEAVRMMGVEDTEECLRRFHRAGAKCVAVKLGGRGSAALMNGEIVFCSSPEVKSVDTTGAGDCFDAGFLYAWMNGEPPAVCLQMANICGALSTEAFGGVDGFPTRERLEEELKRHSCEG
jgi:sugar/nucleoside kinase (ribokinase family)